MDCKGACYREGVGYLARCNLCMKQQLEAGIGEEKVIHSVYQGEFQGSLPFHLQHHYKDYRAQPRKRRKAGGGGGRRGGGRKGGEGRIQLDHISESHRGEGNEEPHVFFEFFLTSNEIA